MRYKAETITYPSSAKASLAFWLQWTLATTVGATAAGAGILIYINSLPKPTIIDGFELKTTAISEWDLLPGFILLGVYIGSVLSISQLIPLQQHWSGTWKWVVGSVFGALLGQFVIIPALVILDIAGESGAIRLIISASVLGTTIGAGQWSALRRYGCYTVWWIPISGLSWSIGTGMAFTNIPEGFWIISDFAIIGVVAGQISGVAMVLLVRRIEGYVEGRRASDD